MNKWFFITSVRFYLAHLTVKFWSWISTVPSWLTAHWLRTDQSEHSFGPLRSFEWLMWATMSVMTSQIKRNGKVGCWLSKRSLSFHCRHSAPLSFFLMIELHCNLKNMIILHPYCRNFTGFPFDNEFNSKFYLVHLNLRSAYLCLIFQISLYLTPHLALFVLLLSPF